MSVHKLKSSFHALLRPLAGRLAAMGLAGGHLTLAATVLALGIGALLLARPEPVLFALVPLFLLLRAGFAAVGGLPARGNRLGEIAGIVSDAALYAPFALVAPFSVPWLTAIVFLAALAELAGMRGAGRSQEGPMGGSDRALLFGALGALVAVFGTLPAWTWHIQPMACVLLAWTIANRLRSGVSEG